MHIDLENPHTGQGPVLLDIGDDHGALIVHAPQVMVGAEIEVHALDATTASDLTREHSHDGALHRHHVPHVAVHLRPVPSGGEIPSAVFVSLAPGRYGCSLVGDPTRRVTATVKAGEVTFAEWPL